MADVAAAAGVSPKTVSNVIRGTYPYIRDETKHAVLRAVDALGYEVNPAGRGLASGRTGRVTIAVPNLYQPYFAEIAERLIQACEELGWTPVLRLTHDRLDLEIAAAAGDWTRDVDGVIYCPHVLSPQVAAQILPVVPLVQLGGAPVADVDAVIMGEYEGARAMTEHLLDGGRTRIAMLGASPSSGTLPVGERFSGYRTAIEARGIAFDPALVVCGTDWDRRASGYEAMVGLLRSSVAFDAVFCVNDAMAIGALRAMRSHGVRIPDDVALSGFDDTEEAEFTTPALSSVSPEQQEMVNSAVRMLAARIGGYAGPPRSARTAAHLVIRDSTRCRARSAEKDR